MEHVFMAAPCVIESQALPDEKAEHGSEINTAQGTDIILKASFDNANLCFALPTIINCML